MIINAGDSFLRVKEVFSVTIYNDPKTEVVKSAGWFSKAETKEIPGFCLKLKYKSEDGEIYTTSWGCGDKSVLVTLQQEIIKQIKDQEHDYVDRELENAIIGGGNDDGSTS